MFNTYISVVTKIWSDKKIRELSAEELTLFLYCLINPEITLTGIYEIDMEICQLRLENKMNGKFDQAFQEIIDNNLIAWDANKSLIWVINRFKYILTIAKSPKLIAGAINELNFIIHPFKDKFIEKYKEDLKPELWREKEHARDYSVDYFLEPDNIINFSKHYTDKVGLKKFLMSRGCAEQRIDDILPRVLPNLK